MTDSKKTEPSEKEVAKRRDEIARRMLNTPPKPHKGKPSEEGGKEKREEA